MEKRGWKQIGLPHRSFVPGKNPTRATLTRLNIQNYNNLQNT